MGNGLNEPITFTRADTERLARIEQILSTVNAKLDKMGSIEIRVNKNSTALKIIGGGFGLTILTMISKAFGWI